MSQEWAAFFGVYLLFGTAVAVVFYLALDRAARDWDDGNRNPLLVDLHSDAEGLRSAMGLWWAPVVCALAGAVWPLIVAMFIRRAVSGPRSDL